MATIPIGKDAEQYIEHQIELGVRPEIALFDLMALLDPHMPAKLYKRQIILKQYGTHPYNFTAYLDNSYLKALELSREFLYKWFIYPSGRTHPRYSFTPNVTIDLENKSIIVTDHIVPTKILGIRTSKQLPFPCFAIIEGELYIPVLRYQSGDNTGLMSYETNYDSLQHCGTYYYLDAGPSIYLRSNKTLIVPFVKFAYFILLGADSKAAHKVLNKVYPSEATIERQKITQWILDTFHTCKEERELITVSDPDIKDFIIQAEGSIQQELCFMARAQGIETIIITFAFPFMDRFNKVEIIDTRLRKESYPDLFQAV